MRGNSMMETDQLLSKIKGIISDIKGLDIVDVDLQGRSSVSEFLVVCSGTSTAHTQGISDNIYLQLKQEGGILPLGIEGYNEGRWILMDYNAVIVHIFVENIREDYNIEKLYEASEAQREE